MIEIKWQVLGEEWLKFNVGYKEAGGIDDLVWHHQGEVILVFYKKLLGFSSIERNQTLGILESLLATNSFKYSLREWL